MKQLLQLRYWPVFGLLALLGATASAILLFIKITDEVLEGETGKIDLLIIMWLRTAGNPADPIGPRWLEDFARDITALGSPIVLGLLVLISVSFLVLLGQRALAFFMLVSALSGTLAVVLMKDLFGRTRPNLMADSLYVYTESFPSGHAMISAVVYLTLAAFIARLVPALKLKVYIMLVAFFLSGLVGFSRVYLGAHWPTDVLAGWAAGAAWALGGGAIAQLIRIRSSLTL